MNNATNGKSFTGAASVILAAFLLFYLPSMLTLLSHDKEPIDMTILSLLLATSYTAIFCLNYLLLVPELLFRKNGKIWFFITNIILIVLACSILPIWFESHGGLPRPKHLRAEPLSAAQWVMLYLRFMIRDGVMMVLSIALAYAMRLSKAREEMQRRELELEAERRNIELLSLKAQLNPHFLFNSLNNIYALIAIDSDKAQKALHDLSSLLRFMIYDSEEASVPLEKELMFINEYVRLMGLRLNPSVRLRCSTPEGNLSRLHIAPLLFLTLIENAFKHFDSSAPHPFIDIDINLDDECLSCLVANSCRGDGKSGLEKGKSGVGLRNVERQLNLIYPESYSFRSEEIAGEYHVFLSIKREVLTPHTQSSKP